jgi:hypothetical protein
MTHFNISGLMSWMKRGMTDSHRNQLLTWAKTEYGNDWEYAYQFMLKNEGQAPTHAQLHGPRIRFSGSKGVA